MHSANAYVEISPNFGTINTIEHALLMFTGQRSEESGHDFAAFIGFPCANEGERLWQSLELEINRKNR